MADSEGDPVAVGGDGSHADGVTEPVHWGARLVRSAAFVYTEVGDVPVLVRPDDGRVEVLTPTWAALWAQLDGRPVREALQVDAGRVDPVDARNLIEVLRRLKAAGVVFDAPTGDRSGPEATDPWRQPTLAGAVDLVVHGSVSGTRRAPVLRIGPSGAPPVRVRIGTSSAGVVVSVRRWLRRRPVDRVQMAGAAHGDGSPVDVLVGIVGSLADRAVLFRPGLVDLLAELAERVAAPGCLPR